MTTTPTSGAADLRDTLINIAREIEALKRECGMDPKSPIAIQNGRYMALSYKVRALAAGQATAAQQGVAYAAPEPCIDTYGNVRVSIGDEVENDDVRFFVGAINQSQMLCSIDKSKSWTLKNDANPMASCIRQGNYAASAVTLRRVRASHGQAPAGATLDVDIDAIALARYKVVPSHESMFHRFAVVAGDGEQQLYLGRETECQNMARKFVGAFLDGAFYQSQAKVPTPSPQAEDTQQAPAKAAPAAVAGPWSTGELDGNWLHIDHKDHAGVIRIVWKMEGDARNPVCEARAMAVIAALNAYAAPTTRAAPEPDGDSWPVDESASRKQLIAQIGQMNFRLSALRQENAGLIKRAAGQAEALQNYQRAHEPSPAAQEDELDAARYRWLTADHHRQEDRARVYEIATSMNVRGKGHIYDAIDAARKEKS